MIYNGSYYYAAKKGDNIYVIRYDLEREMQIGNDLKLQDCDVRSNNYLYKSEANHIDIMADENGVWAVCAVRESNNTAVFKLNITQTGVTIEKTWNISVKHQDTGDMFILCGILYAVDSVTEYETRIR